MNNKDVEAGRLNRRIVRVGVLPSGAPLIVLFAAVSACNTFVPAPTAADAATANRQLRADGAGFTLPSLSSISPTDILGRASAATTETSTVTATCTAALMSTTNTAEQNIAAYVAAVGIALKSTLGNGCLPPGILPFPTVTLAQAYNGVHTVGAMPIQSFNTAQPSLGYTLTGATILLGSGAGGSPGIGADGFLSNVSVENLGFDQWDREFLFGGTNLQG